MTGWKYPEQVVLVSGHVDSWDVGQGAMDDAGPAFVAEQAVALIKQLGAPPPLLFLLLFLPPSPLSLSLSLSGHTLADCDISECSGPEGLRPKRTLRWVGWTTEESGSRYQGSDGLHQDYPGTPGKPAAAAARCILSAVTFESRPVRPGGGAYYAAHREVEEHSLVLELDNGIWRTEGIRLSGCLEAASIMQAVGTNLASINASEIVIRDPYGGDNGLGASCLCTRQPMHPPASSAPLDVAGGWMWGGAGIDVNLWPRRDGVPNFALAQQPNNLFISPTNIDDHWDWEALPVKQHFQGDYFMFHHSAFTLLSSISSTLLPIPPVVGQFLTARRGDGAVQRRATR